MSEAKTVKEVLTAAEWMLENVGWCQKHLYLNEKGEAVNSNDPNLTRMCLVGAINLVRTDQATRMNARTYLCKVAGDYLADFNDSHTKEEVLALVRKAKETA